MAMPAPLTRLGNALASSIGRKIVMGLTGLLLVGFLVEHLHGNLKLLEDADGRAFDEYVAFLGGFGPLLVLAELGLAALFLVHIYLAFRLTLENLQARKQKYAIRNDRGAVTLGSVTMFYSGALILGYLIKHLLDFRFHARFFEAPAALVKETLSQPWHGVVYIAVALVVGVHLSHGFKSAFQSIGVAHPRLYPVLERLGILVAVLFAVGFASIPVYFLFFWDAEAQG
jgi:succinate dehydrogenase / fumarate reductase cytochrome b subunit